ncbi:Uncharacterised protein [Legionella busanensis]|uniref:Uncharacterized protein n=1 Tax=Legionella busanensis TaxID=190655 RepID=A0A378JIK3_9GAMM|nr:hypothetical protein [Legionella busanensis]STX50974.1 Uncharacterised protein [Legionella busanensis]
MIKPQDCLILLKLLANPQKNWTQRCLAGELCISLSEINAGLKRLEEAGLIRKDNLSLLNSTQFIPILPAAEEFLITAVKYLFPAKLGSFIQGMPTAVAAPIFEGKIALGNDPIPVWPDVYGNKKGVALEPIHPSVTKSLHKAPDEKFYELLVLVDAIRAGRARERNIAKELLLERIRGGNNEFSQTR